MKEKNIILHAICTMLIPVVLLFTMGFSERIAAKNLWCAKNNCCYAAIEKKSDDKKIISGERAIKLFVCISSLTRTIKKEKAVRTANL